MTSIDNSLVYGEDSTDGKEGIKKTSKTSNGAVSWCINRPLSRRRYVSCGSGSAYLHYHPQPKIS